MEAKPIEVIMRIDFAATTGTEIVAHAEKISELVRCKDCKYYNHRHHYCDGIGYWFGLEDEWSDNGFCYKGERREDAETIH